MREWLEEVLATFSLSEKAEGYVLGRGILEPRVRDLGLAVWDSKVVHSPAPDELFRDPKKGMGPRGEKLNGRLCIPLFSPRGELIGFEARVWEGEKKLNQYLLPAASWNPVLIGLTPSTMRRIWEGGSVWLVEGVFDLGALERVVPTKDAVLATLRARVSERHVRFLHRFCKGTVNVVYDNDETGRKQVEGWVDEVTGRRRWGAIESLSRVGLRARDIRYRGGKDPGEIWENTGTDGLKRAFADAL
jgi:DNA primase